MLNSDFYKLNFGFADLEGGKGVSSLGYGLELFRNVATQIKNQPPKGVVSFLIFGEFEIVFVVEVVDFQSGGKIE